MEEKKVYQTIEDIENEIKNNEFFKQNIEDALNKDQLDEFLKENNCEVAASEISSLLESIHIGEEQTSLDKSIQDLGDKAASWIDKAAAWLKNKLKK